MMKKWFFSGICAFLVFSLAISNTAIGLEARIQDVLITPQNGQLLAYARVTNCFTKEMETAIMAGVPTTFTFLIDLYQERPGWFDRQIVSVMIRHTIKYDGMKKMFYVTSSTGRESATFQDFENAKRAMTEFNAAIALPVIYKDTSYYTMMKAKLDKIRLPLYMDYIFFFVSLWDFETAWYRQAIVF
ncbi:MAG: DUF4390 domain-containing protein [Syntrophales bacterium]|nr:DUF4390 domain-containing protein [Syntrophales bacterium]